MLLFKKQMFANLSRRRKYFLVFAPLVFVTFAIFLLFNPKLAFATNFVCPDNSTCGTYTNLVSCNNACPNSANYPCYETIPLCVPGPYPSVGTPSPTEGITTAQQVIDVLNAIVLIVYRVFFIVATIFIILAAFSFLTAGGDEEKVKSAKQKLLYAVIAIVIALVSFSVAGLTRDILVNAPAPPASYYGGAGLGGSCSTAADCASPYCCMSGQCATCP